MVVVKLGTWWNQFKRHRIAIGVVAIVLVVVIALIIVGYWFDWTGFNGYNKVTITHTISGTNAGTVTKTEEYQPGKALWDWLNLLALLAIPAVVALGAAWYTAQQGKVSDRQNRDNQREATLQTYIKEMSDIILNDDLYDPQNGFRLRQIAKIRTLTTLRQLDGPRKGLALRLIIGTDLLTLMIN